MPEKQHRRENVFAAPGSNQTGSWTTMAGMVAIDFVTASAPTVAAADIAIKAAFIDINDVLRPVFGNDAAPLPQIGDPLLRITLFVF